MAAQGILATPTHDRGRCARWNAGRVLTQHVDHQLESRGVTQLEDGGAALNDAFALLKDFETLAGDRGDDVQLLALLALPAQLHERGLRKI